MQSTQNTNIPTLDPIHNSAQEPRPENPFSSEKKNPSEKPKKEKSISSTKKPHQTAIMEKRDTCPAAIGSDATDVSSGRDRLKRHRVEVAGRVWIPDMWGQEGFLKDWIDCGAFDASLVNSSIVSARDSLMEEGRRASSTRLRIQNGC